MCVLTEIPPKKLGAEPHVPENRRRSALSRSCSRIDAEANRGAVMPTHAVVWVDHHEARVFHVHPDSTDETTVLIVGPSSAKLELSQYMKDHAATAAAKVVGIESADHPTGGQIVASARRYFRGIDRLAGRSPIAT
jgi:hypothetical protein